MDGTNLPSDRPAHPDLPGRDTGKTQIHWHRPPHGHTSEAKGNRDYAEPVRDEATPPRRDWIADGRGAIDPSLSGTAVVPQSPTRRLVVVLTLDVFDFSQFLALDEEGTIANLGRDRRDRIEPAIRKRGGRIVKCLGDGMLVVFSSVVDAVECALDIQSARCGSTSSMPLRIGINLCDAILEGDDIYGHGVNIAFRVEMLAPPGGICITSTVHETVTSRIVAAFSDTGDQHLKNINRPVHVFVWAPGAAMADSKAMRLPHSATTLGPQPGEAFRLAT